MKITEPLITTYNQLSQVTLKPATGVTLADNLAEGGTTPSKGTIAEATLYAHDHDASINVLVRPRGGVSHYTDPELKIMEADVLEAQQLGADGVTFGATTDAGDLDREGLNNLIAAAGGLSITFGTAIDDVSGDQLASAVSWLAANGVEKVLTAKLAANDLPRLSQLNNLCQENGLQLIALAKTAEQLASVADQLKLGYFLLPA